MEKGSDCLTNDRNNQEGGYEIDLIELFRAIFRKKFLIIFITILCGVLGFAYSSFLATPLYSASAMMIVNSGDRTGLDYVTQDQIKSSSALVSTYSVIIKSDTVMDQVIEKLGMEDSFDSLIKRVTVTAVDDTQIMRISVVSTDPQVAYAVCDKITKVAPKIIVKTVKAGSVEVIEAAKANEKPVSPSIKRNTAIAALIGMVASVAFVVILSLLDTKIKGEADLKQADIAVLGVIPYYDPEEK